MNRIIHKLLILIITVAAFAVGGSARAEGDSVSVFPDKGLEKAVRKYVFEKKYNDEPITEDDVKNLSTIHGKGLKIKDLTGLQMCRALAELDLENNEIGDISQLSKLKRLQSLNLAGNKIKDVAPLAELKKLQYLELSRNKIVDLKPLAGLTELRSLYLSKNEIKDLQPIDKFTKLWSLYLDGNQITDFGLLASLTRLQNLDLRKNQIKDLKPLANYTDLKFLLLDGNKIEDLSVLVAMAKKDAAKEKRFAPFWRVYLIGNPLGDKAKNQQVAELKKLGGRLFLQKKAQK